MASVTPLISCICITYNRIVLLKKAIDCFKAQTYPNKELVISYPDNDRITKHVLEKIITEGSIKIVKLERPITQSLGEARNQAISQSNGDFICTWDDDDWYHPSRLSFQIQYIQKSSMNHPASILNQLILYDKTTHKAYLSFFYPWENTLMCHKDIFSKINYTERNRGEDSKIVDFLEANNLLCHISKMPFLYIYIYHFGNTWGYSHFKSFIERSKPLDHENTLLILELIK